MVPDTFLQSSISVIMGIGEPMWLGSWDDVLKWNTAFTPNSVCIKENSLWCFTLSFPLSFAIISCAYNATCMKRKAVQQTCWFGSLVNMLKSWVPPNQITKQTSIKETICLPSAICQLYTFADNHDSELSCKGMSRFFSQNHYKKETQVLLLELCQCFSLPRAVISPQTPLPL